MKQVSTKIAQIIHNELLQSANSVLFEIVRPINNQSFYTLTTIINGKELTAFLFLHAQKNVLYYFPKPAFKKIVVELSKILKKSTKKEITIAEAPCLKCPHILKCSLNCPTQALFEQIGADTRNNCTLFSQKKNNRDFIDSVTSPYTV